jgi:hypothetical protein
MSGPIDSTGDFEIFAHIAGAANSRSSVHSFDAIGVGDRVALLFLPGDGSSPPYTLKIFSPAGANIIDTIVRELPTGAPQSPPPFEFVVSTRGSYRIEIREMRGRQRGDAILRVG